MKYGELTWPQVRKAISEQWLIIPCGSIEQHGPHLPLLVDTVLAEELAMAVSKAVNGIVAPVIAYGARSLPNSGGGPTYPGTIHLPGDLLIQIYEAILVSYVKNGANQILMLNGHWENEAFLVEAVERCREKGGVGSCQVIVLNWWSVVEGDEIESIFGEFNGWHVEHAGQTETALMLFFTPESVKMENAVDHEQTIPCGIYRHPTPDSWTGTQGILSRTCHTNALMGRQLATLVTERISELLTKKTT